MQQLEKYSNTSELEFSLLKMSEADIPINSYSELSLPTYLMCPPFSYSVNEPNNVWMNIASGDQKVVNLSTAFEQWHRLYSYLVNQGAYIHLVHSPKQSGLQDLVFTANAGITLVKEGKPIVVVSNFSSAPRFGETPVLKKNFEAMGYETLVCPYKFEGEADLKHLRDDIYIGSYGIRSDKRAFEWMEQEFGIKVIKLKMTEEVFFHLDCALFNLTEETIITSPDCFSESEFKELEKYCDIESVTITDLLACITTSVKVNNTIVNQSERMIPSFNKFQEKYVYEKVKDQKLEKIASKYGFDVVFFNLSEFAKGGGSLSCLIMHL